MVKRICDRCGAAKAAEIEEELSEYGYSIERMV